MEIRILARVLACIHTATGRWLSLAMQYGRLGDLRTSLRAQVVEAVDVAHPEGRPVNAVCRLYFGNVLRETDCVHGSANPRWQDSVFEFECRPLDLTDTELVVQLWQWEEQGQSFVLGECAIRLDTLVPGAHTQHFTLKRLAAGDKLRSAGKIGLRLTFHHGATQVEMGEPVRKAPRKAAPEIGGSLWDNRNAYVRAPLPPAPTPPSPPPSAPCRRCAILSVVVAVILLTFILVMYPHLPESSGHVRARQRWVFCCCSIAHRAVQVWMPDPLLHRPSASGDGDMVADGNVRAGHWCHLAPPLPVLTIVAGNIAATDWQITIVVSNPSIVPITLLGLSLSMHYSFTHNGAIDVVKFSPDSHVRRGAATHRNACWLTPCWAAQQDARSLGEVEVAGKSSTLLRLPFNVTERVSSEICNSIQHACESGLPPHTFRCDRRH